MAVPDLSRLTWPHAATAASGAFENRSNAELYKLGFGEVIKGEILGTEFREMWTFPFHWTDGDQTRVDTPYKSTDSYTMTLSKESSTITLSHPEFGPYIYRVEWGSFESVLNAIHGHYCEFTPFWKSVWEGKLDQQQANATNASQALVERFRSSEHDDEAMNAARSYQNGSFACMRRLQRERPVPDGWECDARGFEKWNSAVEKLRSLMVEIPVDMFVASIAEESVTIGSEPGVVTTFLSATLNYRGMQNGDFDEFHNDSQGEPMTMLCLHLKKGTRVLPVFETSDTRSRFAAEYEIIIDQGQHIVEEDRVYMDRPRADGTMQRVRVLRANVSRYTH